MHAIVSLQHFCESHGPQLLLSTQRLPALPAAAAASGPAAAKSCGACGWAGAAAGYATRDAETQALFLSRHYPSKPEMFALVRRACVRSLSSEMCPGREGPLLFGDRLHGYAFSYNFTLVDPAARGGLRHYSISLVMADGLQLVSCWPFLTRHVHILVRDLKAKVWRG